ncbi:hypothetical protein PENTCL1PPCAC_30681, partial [Pristionchus entomophagus]
TGSKKICWIVSSFMAHGHCHNFILLGFSFCYRYYVMKYSSPSAFHLFLVLLLLYTPTAIMYVRFGNARLRSMCDWLQIFYSAAPILNESSLKTLE